MIIEYFSFLSYFAFGIAAVVSNKDDVTVFIYIYIYFFNDTDNCLLQAGLSLVYTTNQPSESELIAALG